MRTPGARTEACAGSERTPRTVANAINAMTFFTGGSLPEVAARTILRRFVSQRQAPPHGTGVLRPERDVTIRLRLSTTPERPVGCPGHPHDADDPSPPGHGGDRVQARVEV